MSGRVRRGVFVQEGVWGRFMAAKRILERRRKYVLTQTEVLSILLDCWTASQFVDAVQRVTAGQRKGRIDWKKVARDLLGAEKVVNQIRPAAKKVRRR